MGAFNHEAAVVDPATGRVYLTEDDPSGPPLSVHAGAAGRPVVRHARGCRVSRHVSWVADLVVGARSSVDHHRFQRWRGRLDPRRHLFFTTKGDDRVWDLDLTTNDIVVLYQPSTTPGAL